MLKRIGWEKFLGFASTISMSALGQKQTCATQNGVSALPPKADIGAAQTNVR
jgi:hypothetical protein